MSSVFKVSCAFYWIIWLICLSYAFGIGIYESRYVIHDGRYENISFIIKILCFIHAGMSFIGCFFVKCDITHLLCCLCFVIPVGLAVPGACIYGISETRDLIQHAPKENETKEFVKASVVENGKYPYWLGKTEEDYRCCGISGYEDYKYFSPQKSQFVEVPRTCCNRKKRNCSKSLKELSTISWEEMKLIKERPGVNSTNFTLVIKSKKGCYKYLMDNTKDAYQAHFAIYILILFCSGIMTVTYMHNFCTYGPCRDEAYLHSLDVEELPYTYMDVKPSAASDLDNNKASPIEPRTPATEAPSKAILSSKRQSISGGPSTIDGHFRDHSLDHGYDKRKAVKTKPATLPASVADSLNHKRLRKYM